MSSRNEILEELSFMDINNESSFGDSDTESNWDDNGDDYGVRVAVGSVEIFPPPIDGDIPIVDVDDDAVAVGVDNAVADIDSIDEGISNEIPNTPREMVYRERFLHISRPTDPQLYLYCHTSSFVEVNTRNHVERLCLMCHFDYSTIVNNNELLYTCRYAYYCIFGRYRLLVL
ncbi:hypothetical protein JTB14_006543 [Gonioctena quinquepunctata]|nr:hypothetical protein JTB14_006543 [Gonioctena quinquepunctata]